MRDAQNKSEKPQQTWMGWNSESQLYMPFGYGRKFPAHLTKRSGLDNSLLRLLLASMNNGVRGETFSKILEEIHALEYYDSYIDREFEIACGNHQFVREIGKNYSRKYLDPVSRTK